MLIHEKITELNELLEKAKTLSDENTATFKAEIQKQVNTLINELQSQSENNLSAKLESYKNELENNITQEAQKYAELILAQLSAQNTDSINKSVEHLQTQNKESKETLQNNLLNDLKNMLSEILPSEILSKPELVTMIESKVQEYLIAHLQNAIDYNRISLDYENIARLSAGQVKALISDEVLENIKAQVAEYHKTTAFLNQLQTLLQDNAPLVWREAIKSDKLINERWEAKLRLESLKIFAIQEHIAEMIRLESAKALQSIYKPSKPIKTKQHILIAK